MRTWTGELVARRLIGAGATLVALPGTGCWPRTWDTPDHVQRAVEAYRDGLRARPAPPPAAAISAMDEAIRWIALLPELRQRRLVWSRMLVRPESGRQLLTWERIGERLGVSDRTARTWWVEATDLVAMRLNRPGLCQILGVRGGPADRRDVAAAVEAAARLRRAVRAMEEA